MVSQLVSSTPEADGFWMPGEYEPHVGCWMAWPRRPDNWRDDAGPARAAFAVVADTIAQSETVRIAANPGDGDGARAMVGSDVTVVEIPSDDAWMRDIGPTFVRNERGDLRAVDWQFNAWGGAAGGLYASWDLDVAMATAVCAYDHVDRYRAPFVLEGGAIHAEVKAQCS